MADMKTKIRLAAALAAIATAAALTGCQTLAPIQNMTNVPVAPASGKGLQASQVRAAIITAGTSLGWRVADAGPGRLEGTLNLRTHTAVVDLPYTASTYGITYKRSDGLNAADGNIHRNYNGWVQNLDRAIRTEISRL
jgi:hypothetical protein